MMSESTTDPATDPVTPVADLIEQVASPSGDPVDDYVDPHEAVVGGVDTAAPVEPFRASVNGALRLLPTTALSNSEPGGRSINKSVTRLQAYTWVQELSSQVAWRITRYRELLTLEGVTLEQGLEQVRLVSSVARNLIHNGVASYIAAATGRGGGQFASTDYAAVLWARYTSGLDDLAARIDSQLPSVEVSQGGIYGEFPEPYIEDVGWSTTRGRW